MTPMIFVVPGRYSENNSGLTKKMFNYDLRRKIYVNQWP